MATTQNTYTGNGTTVLFSFTFPYLEESDIKVEVNGSLTTAYTLANATTIQFNSAPANGAAIRIYRDTDDDSLAATFFAGSAIRSQDLNTNFTQNLFVTQEINNAALRTDGTRSMTADLDLNGNQIINLAAPTTDTNAVNKQYIDSRFGEIDIPGLTRWRKTATAGQTVFSGLGEYGGTLAYSANRESVFINGAFQQRGIDYTADNGTSITITPALLAGDVVEVHCVNNVAGAITDQSSGIYFTQSGTGAAVRTVDSKLKDVVSVKDFGAVGDGVADDTVALQNALNSNRLIFVPPGKYRTTATLTVNPTQNRNTGFIGLTNATRYPYTQQTGGPTWNGTKEPVIFYDGPTSNTAAVIAASSAAVGVEPPATFDATIWTFTLRDITLDANSKAGYGLFTARVQDLQIDHLRSTGAAVAGVSINGTYSGSARSIRCYLNPGRGFELGAADDRFGWTAQDKVNAFYIYDLHADANGSSATFRENNASLLKNNCGVYFGPHRSTHIFGVVSENNFGANIVFEPSGGSNSIHGFYTELGCQYAPSGVGSDAISLGYATRPWGIIFVGSTSALHCRLSDGVCSTDGIWLTGTEPSFSRKEAGFEIYECGLASAGLKADWSNYRLVNSALELETITGSQPAGAFTVKGGIQFGANLTTLNTYNEGTFIPSLAGNTNPGTGWAYTVQAASYTRIGDRVHVQGRIVLSAVSADATGQIAITGLPFTVKNANNYYSAATIANVLNTTTSVLSFEGVAAINTSRINLHKRTAASTSASSVVLSDLSATTSLTFQVSYVAA